MNSLGLGTFTLLPATVVLRAMWLGRGYLVFEGKRMTLDEDALRRDGFTVSQR